MEGASTIDVMADEAVFGPTDVARVAQARTARLLNLGLSKLGGLTSARGRPACGWRSAASSNSTHGHEQTGGISIGLQVSRNSVYAKG